jgi:WD40 repeat protein
MNIRFLALVWIFAFTYVGSSVATAKSQRSFDPDITQLAKLEPEECALGFGLMQPKGFESAALPNAPEGERDTVWQGPPRADNTRPIMIISIRILPAEVRSSSSLENAFLSIVRDLKSHRTSFVQTATERGDIHGLTYMHATWSGMHPQMKRKMRGAFYVTKDRETIIQLSWQSVDIEPVSSDKLMDSSLRTFRKVSQRVYYSVQWPDHSQIWSMKPDGTDRICLTPKSDTDYNPAITQDGTLIAFTTHRSGVRSIWLMNPDGSNQHPLTEKLDAGLCAWSPDGKMLAFSSNRDGKYCIYTMRKDGTEIKKISDGPSDDCPSWASGESIVYEGMQNGVWRIMSVNADGSFSKSLTDGSAHARWPSMSQDGLAIVYTAYGDKTGNRCHLQIMKNDGTMQTSITDGTQNDRQPSWTADGGQILFHSDRTGQYEVYVMESGKLIPRILTPNSKETQQATTAGRMYLP